ncbi:hypothetical protein LUZ60_017650 [Juncus effusus]|nr:hypothetical protein LUZ60_017650 [Juncus effusus]
MDESAISSVLSRLGSFDLSETKFLSDVPSKLKTIETKLRTVYGYLKDSVKKFEPGQLDQPDWLCEIKDVAYRYENCIEKIAWLQRRRNRKRGFIVEWNIERGGMASLSHLRLIQFVEMTEMPEGLNFLTSLKMLEMVEMHELSGDNLKRLEENGCEVIQRDCLDSNGESNATQDYSAHEEVL